MLTESQKPNEEVKVQSTSKEDATKNNTNNQDPTADTKKIIFNFNNFNLKNTEETTNKFIMALKLLNLLKDPCTILSNELALESIEFIYTVSYKTLKIDVVGLVLENGFESIILSLLDYQYSSVLLNLEKVYNSDEDMKTVYPSIKYLRYELSTLMSLTNKSFKFCVRFQQLKCLEVLFKYLSNDFLLRYLRSEVKVDKLILASLKRIFRQVIGTLHNLSRAVDKFRGEWQKLDPVKNLLAISEKIEGLVNFRNCVYMVIANVAKDDEITNLPELHIVAKDLSDILALCIKPFYEKSKIRRIAIQVEEDDESLRKVICYTHKMIIWHLIELLKTLYHMAVNDGMKTEIYGSYGMSEHLRTILYNGNELEVEFALKLLWQLCFDKEIAMHVHQDEKLFVFIKKIKEQSGFKNLVKNAEGILWVLSQKLNLAKAHTDSSDSASGEASANQASASSDISPEKLESNENQQEHIMISYNRDSRDLCLLVKLELEKLGYKIWIDVEHIHGSSLESMANAVENSICVLMCMTEKYRKSTNCRAEAEYSFQLNKPIIPLIMQNNYKPDGWLGIILGAKIFINFTKYEFKECVRRLREELNAILKTNVKAVVKEEPPIKKEVKKVIKKPTKSTPVKKTQEKEENKNIKLPIEKNDKMNVILNESQVEEWFKLKNLNVIILESLRPCDGHLLSQLFSILMTAPEFFYSSLSHNSNINLRDIAKFTYELEQLFK